MPGPLRTLLALAVLVVPVTGDAQVPKAGEGVVAETPNYPFGRNLREWEERGGRSMPNDWSGTCSLGAVLPSGEVGWARSSRQYPTPVEQLYVVGYFTGLQFIIWVAPEHAWVVFPPVREQGTRLEQEVPWRRVVRYRPGQVAGVDVCLLIRTIWWEDQRYRAQERVDERRRRGDPVQKEQDEKEQRRLQYRQDKRRARELLQRTDAGVALSAQEVQEVREVRDRLQKEIQKLLEQSNIRDYDSDSLVCELRKLERQATASDERGTLFTCRYPAVPDEAKEEPSTPRAGTRR